MPKTAERVDEAKELVQRWERAVGLRGLTQLLMGVSGDAKTRENQLLGASTGVSLLIDGVPAREPEAGGGWETVDVAPGRALSIRLDPPLPKWVVGQLKEVYRVRRQIFNRAQVSGLIAPPPVRVRVALGGAQDAEVIVATPD